MAEPAPAQKKRIKVIPILLMQVVLGLGILALGTFAKNRREQVAGALLWVALLLAMFVLPGFFPCQVIGDTVSGSGCVALGLLNIFTMIAGLGSYAYIIGRVLMLRKDPNAQIVAL